MTVPPVGEGMGGQPMQRLAGLVQIKYKLEEEVVFFLAALRRLRYLSSLTRDQAQALSSESVES